MNVILTCYFNSVLDPQRDKNWEADVEDIRTLVESTDHKIVVFTDCLKVKPKEWEHVSFINTQIKYNPYFSRWFVYYDYLISHSFDNVFMLDATDTKILRDPFKELDPTKIYIGDEKDTVGTKFMIENNGTFSQWFKGSELPLLNPGILGGKDVIPVLFDIKMMYMLYGQHLGSTDMGAINFILHTKYKDHIVHGQPLNSHFNKFEQDSTAWIAHK